MSLVPLQQEQLEVIRRILERGLKTAQLDAHGGYIDIFQHLLDELARIK